MEYFEDFEPKYLNRYYNEETQSFTMMYTINVDNYVNMCVFDMGLIVI